MYKLQLEKEKRSSNLENEGTSHGDVASNEMYYHKCSIECCYQK